MSSPLVSIVISPRDRFGFSAQTVEEIYKHTQDVPFEIIFVDPNSPKKVQDQIEKLSKEKKFEYIRIDHFLPPAIARNIGSKRCKGKYIAFVENDCMVTDGWLSTLVRCAEETGAGAVSPLITEGVPLHTIVHFAGGIIKTQKKTINGKEQFVLVDQIHHQGKKLPEARSTMKREETHAFEFHCVLFRRDVVEKMGYFDKHVVSKELIDATLSLNKIGEKIYFEPASLVGFMSEPPLGPALEKMDIPYYLLRWCNEWEVESLHHIRDKWGVTEAEYFPTRYANLGWRRRMFIVLPFCRQLTLGLALKPFENLSYKIEAWWNKRLAVDYQKKYGKLNATY